MLLKEDTKEMMAQKTDEAMGALQRFHKALVEHVHPYITIRKEKIYNPKEEKKANEELEAWVRKYYGPKCDAYEKGCPICEAWKLADKLMMVEP